MQHEWMYATLWYPFLWAFKECYGIMTLSKSVFGEMLFAIVEVQAPVLQHPLDKKSSL